MTFIPADLILRRVNINAQESDTARFFELLYAGEFALKLTLSAFIASVNDDANGHRYQLLHSIVRADGLGEWASKLGEALSGPASQHLSEHISADRRSLTERCGEGTWQFESIKELTSILGRFTGTVDLQTGKVSGWTWFSRFAELRNKTRGHGAITPALCAQLAEPLERSIALQYGNNPIFQRPWAYFHRNMSGRYKVLPVGGDQEVFKKYKTASAADGEHFIDGLYIWVGSPRHVQLVKTDLDVSDFFLPNGAFNGRTFELHSLISDERIQGDATPYLAVAGGRPPSETEGRSELDVIGKVFTNLPSLPADYVRRPRLEKEVYDLLTNDRHPIVTLVGRGGIGKTSLALTVLHEITNTERFSLIVWFSARDIDLTLSGPKVVKARVLTEKEIAQQYLSLVEANDVARSLKGVAVTRMFSDLAKSHLGPTLFVFDNFETVQNPIDLFNWLDTGIRNPNKIVITSRMREFKADYPVDVLGMEQEEAESLVERTAAKLGISGIVGAKERDQIIDECGSHPYVMKIILGGIANSGNYVKPSSLIVRQDDILDALFERSFANLSPMAARIFLTISGWRSLVPQLAVEAVLLRHRSEGGDPSKGIDELVRMSLVERVKAFDDSDFLSVPLAAALFGRKKIDTSPLKEMIEGDTRFLQEIGATSKSGLRDGLRPRVLTLFKKAAESMARGISLNELAPVLEFVARGFPPAWLMLAELYDETNLDDRWSKAEMCLRRFLESAPPPEQSLEAWQHLIKIYKGMNDAQGACSAFLNAASISRPLLGQVSQMAQILNADRESIVEKDSLEYQSVYSALAALMEEYLPDCSATDLSRLAWLHLHGGDDERALDLADQGLTLEPFNLYCRRLVGRLRH